MHAVLAEIFGPDLIIVIVVAAVVIFGGSRIPKLARSLGSAQSEFKKGIKEGQAGEAADPAAPAAQAAPVEPAPPSAAPTPAPEAGTPPATGTSAASQ